MKSSSTFALAARLSLAAALLVPAACQSGQTKPPAPPPEVRRAQIASEFTASAQVTALALAEPRVTLRREDGSVLEVRVDASVRNFDQIAVDDTLRVRNQETLAAKKLPAGTAIPPAEGALMAARAKPGAAPGAGVGLAVSVRVRIESIDREREIVIFSLASGELIARRLQTAEGRTFTAALEVGRAARARGSFPRHRPESAGHRRTTGWSSP